MATTADNVYIAPLLKKAWDDSTAQPSPLGNDAIRVNVPTGTNIYSPIEGAITFTDGAIVLDETVPIASEPDHHLQWVFRVVGDNGEPIPTNGAAFLALKGRLLAQSGNSGFDIALKVIDSKGNRVRSENPISVLSDVIQGFPLPGEPGKVSPQSAPSGIDNTHAMIPLDPDQGNSLPATVPSSGHLSMSKRNVLLALGGVVAVGATIGVAIAVSKSKGKGSKKRR